MILKIFVLLLSFPFISVLKYLYLSPYRFRLKFIKSLDTTKDYDYDVPGVRQKRPYQETKTDFTEGYHHP